jgi:eukaryotic-like serine/threonine-protein kinase
VEAERWRQIEQLYHSALEREESRRAAFLEQACGGDESLRREVESLLAQVDDTESFLETPALDLAARDLATSPKPGTFSHPEAIGRYHIVRVLGEGGMGTVYEAVQEEPRRVVALKVIKLGLATPDRLRRFRQESQALARLQHPGIAQIYESSTADTGLGPQPFFAMEFIRGLPLNKYAEVHQLDTRQKLALMVKICEAVHHAHQRGLIHRDLKPGNILVDETGQPKILDFGVARIIEADPQESDSQPTMTGLGQLVGTLAYMSPEQVLGDPLEVDTRSDVYALGVILYELLAGRLPYQVNPRQLTEAVHTIREEEPASLSSIGRDYRGDIETLVRKALEKDKTRRFTSAADLGADILRHLHDEPIMARPPSAVYQLRKFARRHRGLMAGMAAVLVVLLAGVAVSAWMAVRASRAEAEARAVSEFLQKDLLAEASASTQAGPNAKPDPHLEVRTVLDRAAARIPGKFQKQPLVEASIRQTIGEAYADLGLFSEAEQQEQRALTIRGRILGEAHPDTLESMDRLAILYRLEGKYAEAEPLRKKFLEVRRQKLGELHPDTLDAMNNLALLYRYEGKPGLAEPLYVKAVEGLHRLKGVENRQTVLTMANLAQLYDDQAKYAQAEQLYGEVLEAAPRVLGEEHPDTLILMNNLAMVYQDEGKFAQAELLQRKVMEVDSRVLGAEHPDTLIDFGNMAKLYRNQGKYPEAEALFTRTLETERRVLGEDQPVTMTTMSLLGSLKGYEGKYADAEQLLTRALDGQRRVLGNEHRSTQNSLVWLGQVRLQQQKYAQAEANFRAALNIYVRTNPEVWQRYNCQSLLGASLAGEGKYDEAEPQLLAAYETMLQRRDQIPAANRPDLETAGAQIVRLYDDWGKPDKAAEWRSKLNARGAAPKQE